MNSPKATNWLLTAILVVLCVFLSRTTLFPSAQASGEFNTSLTVGCYKQYSSDSCKYIPLMVDSQGRLVVLTAK